MCWWSIRPTATRGNVLETVTEIKRQLRHRRDRRQRGHGRRGARPWWTPGRTRSRWASARGRSAPRGSSPASACRRSRRSTARPAACRRAACRSSPTAASATPATSPRPWRPGPTASCWAACSPAWPRRPGQTIIYKGRSFKTYRGMGSLGAMVAGLEGPLPAGRGVRPRQAGARGRRGARALQGAAGAVRLPAGGRAAGRHGLLRHAEHRGTAHPHPVHPGERGVGAGEPSS